MTTEFRVRFPSDGTTDTDLVDVTPLRDSFQRFASGATLTLFDDDGSKIDDYPYGERVEVQTTTDGGSTWSTRLAGVALTPTRTTRQGFPELSVDVVGYAHLLTRTEAIVKDYSSTAKSTILNDLITTFSPVKWVAGNVDVQNDDAIDYTVRGETVASAVDHIASESADEEWGVNNDLEFFFRQQSSSRAPAIGDADVISHDLPRDGKREVNAVKLYYTSNEDQSLTVEDREAQKDLKEKLGAPRRVVIQDTDSRPEISSEAEAEAVARDMLDDQSEIQTGTVTVPLGRFDTESGDVVNLTVSDAGITGTDFRVAQIDYFWQRGEAEFTIAENAASNVDELLLGLTDRLVNERLNSASTAAAETKFLDLQSGAEVSLSATLTTKTAESGSFIVGQSQLGDGTDDTLGGGVSSRADVSVATQTLSTAALNMFRDVWQGESSTDLTHLAAGTDATEASRADTSLHSEVDRVEVEKVGKGNQSERFEVVATIPAGGIFADSTLRELGVFDAASGGTGYHRLSMDPVDLDDSTRLKIHIEGTVDVDTDETGVVTSTGQQRLRDLWVGDSGHEPTDMVWGSDDTDPAESDSSLGAKQHEDTIDSTADRAVGVTDVVERITASDANPSNFSEVGVENAADELLTRLVFEAYGEDVVVEGNTRLKVSNQ